MTANRMAPYLDDGDVQLYHGDAITVLQGLPAGIAQTCVTSPPYWGLRDYGTGTWTGGGGMYECEDCGIVERISNLDSGCPRCGQTMTPVDCDHLQRVGGTDASTLGAASGGNDMSDEARERSTTRSFVAYTGICGKCGAQRVDSQLGLEATPDLYVENMVRLFREVRRVLRDDGTLWLNLGDSYAAGMTSDRRMTQPTRDNDRSGGVAQVRDPQIVPQRTAVAGLKPKDLVGIPWRVAFALQADGWYLRSDIIWSKPNPMPESVTDRPTKAHEYLFLLAKGQWKSRVVQCADLPSEPLHVGADLGSKSPDLVAGDFGVRIATAILERTKLEQEDGLPMLDPQMRDQRLGGGSSPPVGHLPVEHWAAVLSARLLGSEIAPKEFLCELHRRGIALSDGKQFLVADGLPLVAMPPGVTSYGEAAIAVHHPGQVRQFDLGHNRIIVAEPSTCRYFYDADAIREPHAPGSLEHHQRYPNDRYAESGKWGENGKSGNVQGASNPAGRNRRSVWTIPTEPFPEAHFATYPQALVTPCIQAGTSERGECAECGAPWTRKTIETQELLSTGGYGKIGDGARHPSDRTDLPTDRTRKHVQTVGWEPSCRCVPEDWEALPLKRQLVLDPFVGSGTTCLVARKHGRRCIGIDLSAEYLDIAAKRTQQLSLLGGAA